MAVFVLMGVSGAGKTTVGKLVARELHVPFLEGDDFHPAQNIAKMSSGTPLDDQDRVPWIDAITSAINARPERDLVLACSALSNFIRQRLRGGLNTTVLFLFLTADMGVIEERLKQRPRHYMKPGMLGSQLSALQAPPDAIRIEVDRPIAEVTAEVARHIRNYQQASASEPRDA